MLHVKLYFEKHFLQEYLRWVLFAPVALGLGILLYFSLPFQPSLWMILFVFTIFGCGFFLYRPRHVFSRLSFWALCCIMFGFFLTHVRTEYKTLKTKVFFQKDPLWIEGRVAQVEHLSNPKRIFQKVLLKEVVCEKKPIEGFLQIVIQTQCQPLHEGDRIRLLAKVSNPFAASDYLNDNYAKINFFQQIVGKGFALSSPVVMPSLQKNISFLRHSLTRILYAKLTHPFGAMACALITGDKAGLSLSLREAFSNAGLSHVLAISGLHLSAVTACCFFLLTRCFACIPFCALYMNLQKWASVFSCGLGFLYLKISGNGYPAQRSFWMLFLVMAGVFFSRKTLSIRNVMLCAAVFLCLQPEALLSLSFQLSFAAVISLISFFEKSKTPIFTKKTRPFIFLETLKTSILSSSLGCVLSFPILIFYFQSFSLQMILTNIIAIPLVSLFIMPVALMSVISLCLPLIVQDFFFSVFQFLLKALYGLAFFSNNHFKSLIFQIPLYSKWFFMLQILGLIWFLLWKTSLRYIGLALSVFSFVLALLFPLRPDFLTDPSRRVFAFIDHSSKTLFVSRKTKTCMRWAKTFGCKTINVFQEGQVFFMPLNYKVCFENASDFYKKHDKILVFKASSKEVGPKILGLEYLFEKEPLMIYVKKGQFCLYSVHSSQRPWHFFVVK